MQFIDLQAQYQLLKTKIDARIHGVLDHGQYIMGPEVQELEEQLASYVGVKHAITCANGTDALQLALMALGIGVGDVVLTTTFTFFATAEVISLVGATPIFVDVDEGTFNIDPEKLEGAIKDFKPKRGKQLKAVIAVDLFGLPADYSRIESICKRYDLKLIEDAAQGFGGKINNQRAGSFGDIATTSFFPAKPLGCYGDGGAVFTDDDELAVLIKSLRVHGKGADKYDNVCIGMNSRLDTMQAAILLEKLAVFENEVILRNNVAVKYTSALKGSFLVPHIPVGYRSAWAQYTLVDTYRSKRINMLKKHGVPSAIYYGKCMHQQEAFRRIPYKDASVSTASKLSSQVFSLPMHPYLNDESIEVVVSSLLKSIDGD